MTASRTIGTAWRKAARGAGSMRPESSCPFACAPVSTERRCQGPEDPALGLVATAEPFLPPSAEALGPKVRRSSGYTTERHFLGKVQVRGYGSPAGARRSGDMKASGTVEPTPRSRVAII